MSTNMRGLNGVARGGALGAKTIIILAIDCLLKLYLPSERGTIKRLCKIDQ